MPEYTPELRAKVDAAIARMRARKPLVLGNKPFQDFADVSTWLRSVDAAKTRLAGFAPALVAKIDADAERIASDAERIAELERDNARLVNREIHLTYVLNGLLRAYEALAQQTGKDDLLNPDAPTWRNAAIAALKDTAQ